MLQYFNKDGQELVSVNYSEGALWQDYMFEQTVDVEDEIKLPAVQSYISEVIFTDGEKYTTSGPDDENIQDFEFVPFGEYAEKEVKSYKVRSMLSLENWEVLKDRPWTQFRRFLAYTEEEKEQMQEGQESAQETTEFMKNGPELLAQLKQAMNSLQSAFAE